MIARIARTFVLLQLLLVGYLYQVLRADWHPVAALALAVLLVAAGRALIVAAGFCLTWPHRGAEARAQPLGLVGTARLFLGEYRAIILCSSWGMPFRHVDTKLAPGDQRLPVLLIHGYGCNSGYWHWMSRALRAAGISHAGLDLEPLFGDIDGYAAQVDAAVTQLRRDSGQQRVILLAHSMGGLASRAYLRRHGAACIAGVITLGTPHHGTHLARIGFGLNSHQMKWRNADSTSQVWLHGLADAESDEVRALFTSIWSRHDNIVAPQSSAELPGAHNIAVAGIGHVALGLHPLTTSLAIECIRELRGAAVARAVPRQAREETEELLDR